jgi:hypothetical protein
MGRINVTGWLAVDDAGGVGWSFEGPAEAQEAYSDEHGSGDALDVYQVEFSLPEPSYPTIKVHVPDPPVVRIPDTFTNVTKVNSEE